MGLLIWKIIGYGVVILVVGGIAISVLSAAITILVYASMPFLVIGFLAISFFTYPITLCLRNSGRNCRSFFEVGIETWKRWHTPHDQSEQKKARYDGPKSEQYSEYREQRTQNYQQSTEDAFDPWKILGIEPRASKQTIATAFRKKMMTNHPDKVANLDPDFQKFATDRTVQIRRAYDHFMNNVA